LKFSAIRVQLPGFRDCAEQPLPLGLNARKVNLRKRQRDVIVFEKDCKMAGYVRKTRRLYEYKSQNNAHLRRKLEPESDIMKTLTYDAERKQETCLGVEVTSIPQQLA
jgi:hypothetical protein